MVYAFVKNIHPPKHKYFVTIYRDEEQTIVTCFTTTQNRVGHFIETLQHGYVKKDGQVVGYCFDSNVEVGLDLAGEPFKFPRRCVIPFNYGVNEGTKEQYLRMVEQPVVVCRLHQQEYANVVYAMYRSPLTNPKYKPYLDKVLQKIYGSD